MIIKTAHVAITDGGRNTAQVIDLRLVIPLDTTLREYDKNLKRMWYLEQRLRECDKVQSASLSVAYEKKSSARIVDGHLAFWPKNEVWTPEEHRSLLQAVTEVLREYDYDVCGR